MCDREWLVYSKELDKMFCFCCKVFRNGAPKGRLGGVDFDDWHHATGRVREHEVSLDHLINMKKWFDLRKRLKSDDTIDNFQHEQFKKEADYWKQVLFRIIALIKFLAKHNLAFRGNKEKLYEKGNENFLGLVEMLEEFDPVIVLKMHSDVLEYMKEDGYSPEVCIAYRILLTILVTVASAERSFSKLKLLKSYLRSSMSQERLSGLAMIAIENEVLNDINCEELIHQFAIKNARRASRIIG
ncbi:putative transcription factor and/or regulators TTF-type(Zn) family [Helianthus debilis subsp. tardiflorus]